MDKILSSYCDIRVDTLKQMTEKRNENENVIINVDINHVQKGDNENKKEKNRYVAEDDIHNNVTNTITLEDDYLWGAEIKVNYHSTKNILEVGDCNKTDEDCKRAGVNQRIGKKKGKTVREKRNGKSNVGINMITR